MHLLYFVTCCPFAESPERRGLWEVPRFREGHKGKHSSRVLLLPSPASGCVSSSVPLFRPAAEETLGST